MLTREINLKKVKNADIVVGIPSYNEADLISYPVKQVDIGLRKYFPDMKSVIINCDNNSPDGTEEAFLNTETEIPKIYITTPSNVKGKGYNFENLFRKTYSLKAEMLICVDADLKSITPKWIKYFGEAILSGYDYVTPLYSRHKYDGTITNNICYPLVYGVVGKNIRQPIGGDFALNIDFVEYLIKQTWYRTAEEYGIDIFMTMNAIFGGFKICEAGLGSKIHKPSAPNLGPMFLQVVNSIFFLIIKNMDFWKNIKDIDNCKLFGLDKLKKPQDLAIDKQSVLKKAFEGFEKSNSSLKKYLEPDNYSKIKNIFASKSIISLDADLWSKIVYNMIWKFDRANNESVRNDIVESLRCIYFARFGSFIEQTYDMTSEKAEDILKEQAKIFFKNRKYLINKLTN